MRTPYHFIHKLLLVFAFCSLIPFHLSAQLSNVQPRITAAVDETKLTVLGGNTHPLASAQFDRGPAPASLPMEGMLLVLKRSPDQQAALETLLAEQQDQSSPNYHKWLTPAEFGSEFGPANEDIQTITSWLESHGFQVGNVSNGRTVIEFSGTAAQVQEALHTTIHQYVVNGEEHWANSTDPSIPAAFTQVVAGVRSLHNFHPKAMHRVSGIRTSSNSVTEDGAVKPQFTFPSGCTSATCFFGLGPVDFATIYNVLPLWNAGIDGTGETIAVVSDSNINLQDVTDFRSMFGLPAKLPTVIVPTTISGCTDPGLQPTGDEIEAILDVEWSGAVARNANIDLVTCKSTTTFGGDLAAEYIIDYPNAAYNMTTSTGLAPILSESFGDCEFDLGSTANAMYSTFWSQAAAEGITVIVSTGDNGSAGCDVNQVSGSPTQPAKFGLEVNGLASTPFNVAVGGTDFSDLTNPFTFWNQSSGNAASTGASVLSYIPETAWNDTCANPVVYGTFFTFSSAAAACNNGTVGNDGYVVPVGGSGGVSGCTTYNGANPLSCTGGYSKPSWQSGGVTPNDGKRDIPDISLFAGDGTISGSFYIVCERDYPQAPVKGAACSLSLNSHNFLEVGGTSVSTQAFAGIMALVDQKNESAEGLINPTLYSLAGTAGKTCTSVADPSPTCVFYDVADGSTNAMPCQAQATGSEPVVSPDCPLTSSGPIGILTNPTTSQFAYSAGVGYDLATGLGSVNAANFVNAPTVWNTASSTHGVDFTLSFTNSSTLTIPKGQQGMIGVTVTSNNGFAGAVSIACPLAASLPSGVTCSVGALVNGSASLTFVTTAASTVAPVNPANHIGFPGIGATTTLACAFCMFLLLLAYSDRKRRLTATMAMAAFALLVVSVAGCGGGSGGGGGGGGGTGTPTGTSFVTITATSGSIQRSLALTLTVD